MRVTLLAISSLVMACFTSVMDPNHWELGDREFQEFLSDSDACRYEATPQLQPELPDEPDEGIYRSCMESAGWTQR